MVQVLALRDLGQLVCVFQRYWGIIDKLWQVVNLSVFLPAKWAGSGEDYVDIHSALIRTVPSPEAFYTCVRHSDGYTWPVRA